MAYCVNNKKQVQQCTVSHCPCCDGLGVAAVCTYCNGTGHYTTRTLRESQLAHEPHLQTCTVCLGRGYIPITPQLVARLGFAVAEPSRES